MYKSSSPWDLIASSLSSHLSNQNVVKCLSAAAGMFARHGRLSHSPICDSLVAALDKNSDKSAVAAQVL